MDKKKYNKLVQEADEALQQSEILQPDGNIYKSYNGQAAALGVSIAMSGLLPTLAIYYQDYDANNNNTAYRRYVLNIIAKMVMHDNNQKGKDLFEKALRLSNSKDVNDVKELSKLKSDIIDCSVALKQVIRTYTLIDEKEGKKKGE